jgi:hypothetical protein
MVKKSWKPTKKKSTAVILAILFGIFSWCYTYKYDGWKFWLNLFLAIASIFVAGGLWGIVALIWVIIDQATKPNEFYDCYFD